MLPQITEQFLPFLSLRSLPQIAQLVLAPSMPCWSLPEITRFPFQTPMAQVTAVRFWSPQAVLLYLLLPLSSKRKPGKLEKTAALEKSHKKCYNIKYLELDKWI